MGRWVAVAARRGASGGFVPCAALRRQRLRTLHAAAGCGGEREPRQHARDTAHGDAAALGAAVAPQGCRADLATRTRYADAGRSRGYGRGRPLGTDARAAGPLRPKRNLPPAGRVGPARGLRIHHSEPAADVDADAVVRICRAVSGRGGGDMGICRRHGILAERGACGRDVLGVSGVDGRDLKEPMSLADFFEQYGSGVTADLAPDDIEGYRFVKTMIAESYDQYEGTYNDNVYWALRLRENNGGYQYNRAYEIL